MNVLKRSKAVVARLINLDFGYTQHILQIFCTI